MVFHLTEKQAIYLTAKSDTPTAADITVQLVEVFTAWRNGDLEQLEVKPSDVQVFGMMFQSTHLGGDVFTCIS